MCDDIDNIEIGEEIGPIGYIDPLDARRDAELLDAHWPTDRGLNEELQAYDEKCRRYLERPENK